MRIDRTTGSRAGADSEELWRQRVGAMRSVPRLLRELGVDPAPVLVEAGLEESALELADNTIPYAAFGRLLDKSARHTGCPHFGLLAGRTWKIDDLGLAGQIMRNAATVRDALRCAFVYHHLNSQGGVAFVREYAQVGEFGYAVYCAGVQGGNQIHDAVLATQVSFMRELCGPAWVPSQVLLAHAPPADAGPYRSLFRCPVRFNAELYALRFPRDCLDRPLPGSDAVLLRRLELQANELAQPDLIDRLRRSLRVLLLSGVASGDAVADMLAMHRRTLNRRLEALGTTFRDVLGEVRFAAACQLLASTDLSLDDIAGALGYAGVSPFTRAFRRLAGMPPGHWRRQLIERAVESHGAPDGPPAEVAPELAFPVDLNRPGLAA